VKAKSGVVDFLNKALTTELTAINQYFVQSEMCKNWGYERLAAKLRAISLEEMEDTESLIRHILFLEGIPNMQRMNQVQVGETVAEHLQLDLELERAAAADLVEAIAHCAQVGDYNTRRMFEEMLKGEEEHVDYFETQLETISQIGMENYLSQQLKGD
jgi:bacterioferritin